MKQVIKGNAIVGQSGGPTAAINATLSGIIRGVEEQMEQGGPIFSLYGMKNGIAGLLNDDILCISDIINSDEKHKILEQTPSAVLGSCRRKLPDPLSKDPADVALYEQIFSILQKHDIRYFFYIGGNDSMDTVRKLSQYVENNGKELTVIGVPKTVDNDLPCCDHAPGYGSAARYIAITAQEILRDCACYRTPAVTVVECMGRDAGWLTAATAVGKKVSGQAPDLIYFAERPFSMEQFFSDVEKKFQTKDALVVAVSEGIRFADGTYVGEANQNGVTDIFGHKYLAGAGKTLEHAIKARFGCKVRSIELSLPQRCAGHLLSSADIEESIRVGAAAVHAAAQGVSGKMMVLLRKNSPDYVCEISHVDVSRIANHVRPLPDCFINAEGNHVTEECIDHILPLIGDEMPLLREFGIPKHMIL